MMELMKIIVLTVILSLRSVSAEIIQNIDYIDNVNVISAVFTECKASTLTILYNSRFEDLNQNIAIFNFVRSLTASKKLRTVAINYRNWEDVISLYNDDQMRQIDYSRPLIVAIILTHGDLLNFESIFERIKSESNLFFFVLFIKSRGLPLLEFCFEDNNIPLKLRVDSNFVVRCYQSNTLKKWYTLDGIRMQVQNWAIWNADTKVFTVLVKETEKKVDLGGKELRIGIIRSSQATKLEKGGKIGGFLGEIFESLRNSMNFTYSIEQFDVYGSQIDSTSNWTGGIGALTQNTIDLLLSDLSMISSRIQVIDFTNSLLFSRQVIYVKDPNFGNKLKWAENFQTFSIRVWMMILIFILIAPLILTLIRIRLCKAVNFTLTLMDSYFQIWQLYCNQGMSESTTKFAVRLIYLMTSLLAFIIHNHYSASVMSFAMYPQKQNSLKSMEDLIKDGTYKLSVMENTASYDILKYSKDPLFQEIFTKWMLKKDQLVTTFEAGFDQVCKEKVGFMMSGFAARNAEFEIKCDLHEIVTNRLVAVSMAVPKGHQYLRQINQDLLKLRGNGMLNRLMNKYHQIEKKEKKKKANSIGLYAVIVLFTILIVGNFLSLIIFLIEKLLFDGLESEKRISMNENLAQIKKLNNFKFLKPLNEKEKLCLESVIKDFTKLMKKSDRKVFNLKHATNKFSKSATDEFLKSATDQFLESFSNQISLEKRGKN